MLSEHTKKPPSNRANSKGSRQLNTFSLVLCSFAVGALFGASLWKFHGESLNLSMSRMASLQEDMAFVEQRNDCRYHAPEWARERNDNPGTASTIMEEAAASAKAATETQPRSLTNSGPDQTTTMKHTAFAKFSSEQNQKQSDQTQGKPRIQAPSNQALAKEFHQQKSQSTRPYAQWCPDAKCLATELCRPCQRRFLIVISTARSASTTLTWMLDALPGVRMSGENNNTLGHLKRLMDNVLQNPNFKHSVGLKGAWGHHYVPPQSLSCVSQAMIEGINPPPLRNRRYIRDVNASQTDIIGFKTIRFLYDTNTTREQASMVDWLRANFPCSRVIVNINSNVNQYVQSLKKAWKLAINEVEAVEGLRKENDRLLQVARSLGPKQAFLLDSAEWTHNITKLNEVVTWLGFHTSCHFTELLELNTKKGYGNTKTTIPTFNSTCQRL